MMRITSLFLFVALMINSALGCLNSSVLIEFSNYRCNDNAAEKQIERVTTEAVAAMMQDFGIDVIADDFEESVIGGADKENDRNLNACYQSCIQTVAHIYCCMFCGCRRRDRNLRALQEAGVTNEQVEEKIKEYLTTMKGNGCMKGADVKVYLDQ